jgi:hypothetical protein
MKRVGNLFETIAEYDNLRLATARALRGKRHRPDARRFVAELDLNLLAMRRELLAGTIPLGHSHQFVIHDPKRRIITAPCFPERVLHHAVMNVCEPVFERWLIDDSYACRRGRGRIAALCRAARFTQEFAFFLKLDVRKYFDSIPHDRLLARLERLFKDHQLLDLFGHIVRAFRGSIGTGLPIGSLTSQHFANFYLGWFDRAVKERWRIRGYVRYMDDMLLWSHSKLELQQSLANAIEFLRNELGLEVKSHPYLNRSRHGVEFLGCRLRQDGVTLSRRSRVRFGRKLRAIERQFLAGEIGERELQQRATALLSFTTAGGVTSWQFRRAVLQETPVSGHEARTG